jgi:hypothetical protein
MSVNIRHLNVHIPIELDNEIKAICKERKAKGLPNATMRILVVEILQKYIDERKKSQDPKRFAFED